MYLPADRQAEEAAAGWTGWCRRSAADRPAAAVLVGDPGMHAGSSQAAGGGSRLQSGGEAVHLANSGGASRQARRWLAEAGGPCGSRRSPGLRRRTRDERRRSEAWRRLGGLPVEMATPETAMPTGPNARPETTQNVSCDVRDRRRD